MRLLSAFIFTLVLIFSGVRAGEFSIAAEGNLAGDLYETGYFCGIAPGYTLKFENDRELLCALVLRVRGDLIIRSDYRQHTQFLSIGGDVAWYRPLFIAQKIRILWGPETYYHYGFCPITWRTMGGVTTRDEYTDYFLHNGGITWPVRLDFRFAKHGELRVTERLLGVEVDSRWVKGYDSTIKFKAGLTPMLSPVVSFVVHF